MSAPAEPTLMRKWFTGDAPWTARKAASDWLSDFSQHGPLDLHAMRVIETDAEFIAVVTYSDMVVETSPRYFDKAEPLLKTG